MDCEQWLLRIAEQEQRLQFDAFTNEDALELGLLLVGKARQGALSVNIDITRAGQVLFHCAMAGTSPDNDQWILRKNKVVNRYHKSSFFMQKLLERDAKTLEEAFEVSAIEYAAHGGAFPIRIRNVGVVGTVTISGLTSQEDHELAVEAIEEYLGRQT